MKKHILVTGGAGFIGSYIVDELLNQGHDVRILDNFEPQVHKKEPNYLNKNAEFIKGDILNRQDIEKAIQDIDVIFHEAAMVGVGQSMYQPARYVKINTYGTALLWDCMVNSKTNVKKFIVASSMSTYGEGKYKCENCGVVYPSLRSEEQLKKGIWEMLCPNCSKKLSPLPTDEKKPQDCQSIYALSKKDQEEMTLMIGKAYGIPSIALRYFNVYGPRQSLNNPYTGLCAIFNSRIKNNNPPLVYEDGLQTRDFVNVKDIASANIFVMENSSADYNSFNIGTGIPTSVLDIAKLLIKGHNSKLSSEIAKTYRKGDIRHCYSDISKIKSLGWTPKIKLEEGINELISWAREESAEDNFEKAQAELKERKLI